MEPINYLANVPNPAGAVFQGLAAGTAQQANEQQMAQAAAQEARAAELQPFAVQGAQLGLDAGRQNMAVQADQNARANEMQPFQVQQAQQQIAQQQRAAAFQNAAGNLAALGSEMTIADLQSVAIQFPEYGEAVVGSFQAMNAAQQQSVAGVMAQAAFALKNGHTATANDLIDEYAAAAEASGNAEIAATARAIQQTADIDPNAALMSLGLALQTIAPEAAARIFDTGESRVSSSISVGPTISVQTMANGETRVVDTATNAVLTGQAAQDAIAAARAGEIEFAGATSAARAEGTRLSSLELDPQIEFATTTAGNEANIQTGGNARAAEALGGEQSNMVVSAIAGASAASSSMSTIREAIAAIDAGAASGILSGYIPTITQSTASLENAMNRMGLDVIGSVTFGALSEAELRIAMETAAPRSLRPDVLKPWLEARLKALEQIRAAQLDQAEFLSDPRNSISDWVASVKARSQPAAPAAAPTAPAATGGALPLYLQNLEGN